MARCINVLIVEDDPCVLESLAGHLAAMGHRVVPCGNATEALAALRQEQFQLLITDAEMEGINGLELIRHARKSYPDLSIIMMTAYEGKYPMADALLAGADGFLSKPFSLRSFSMILERSYWEAVSRPDWWDRNMRSQNETAPKSAAAPSPAK
ncbi:MAG TPA: response regulator [Candidatus Hydrogenedentes bacterium]|nr:response regulator [Candidatus Hydrogenedentota bacterium]